jgi:phosphoglycolate/pyridoxal phosphate phosphatase family enzyme
MLPCTAREQAWLAAGAIGGLIAAKFLFPPQRKEEGEATSSAVSTEGTIALLDATKVKGLLPLLDCFIFDCDGVLWSAEHAIPGAAACINRLMKQGKKVYFVTNNALKHRNAHMKKLNELGFTDVKSEQVYSSGFATAMYLKNLKAGGKVFTTGMDGLVQELNEAGLDTIGGEQFAKNMSNIPTSEARQLPLDPEVRAVVVSFSAFMNYAMISLATRYLLEPGVLFIATNCDKLSPQAGVLMPGAGTFVAALEYATSRKAILIGKPEQLLLTTIFDANPDLQRGRSIMIGDRLDTDIEFGNRGGLMTMLVLSGTTSLDGLKADRSGVRPALVADSVAVIADALPA